MAKGSRLVTAIAFSGTGRYIAASDAAEQICVHLFERQGKSKAIDLAKINMKVANITWNPNGDAEFASVGAKHLCVYTLNNGKMKMNKASSKDTGNTNMCCVSWCKEKKYAGQLIAGGADGNVYHCLGKEVKTKVKNSAKGSVHSVCSANDSKAGGEVVLVGGNDKTLNCYFMDGKSISKSPAWALQVSSPPRSIDLFNGNILMGYKNGSLTVAPFSKDGSAKPEVIMTSHCDGEVWGLQIVEVSKG